LFDLSLVLLLLAAELVGELLRVLLGLVEEVGVFDLQFVALLVELEFGFFHGLLVFLLEVFDLVGVFLVQRFDFVADVLVPLHFEIDLFLVVLLQLLHLLLVAFLLHLQLLGQFLVLLRRVLDVGVFDLLVRLQRYLVLLL
jgi:hypothetical protein